MFWTIDGSLVVDDAGRAISCDSCPCIPLVPCCPDTTPQRIYAWFCYLSDTAFGCIDEIMCPASHGQPNVYFLAGKIGEFNWNVDAPGTTLGRLDCLTSRFITSCDGSSFNGTVDINFGTGYQGTQSISHPGDPCILADVCQGYSPVSGAHVYFSTRDPSTGIIVPGVGTISSSLSFMLTLGGVDYTGNLKFSAGAQVLSTAVSCYSWVGFLTDCFGECTRVQLSYIDLGGGIHWHLIVLEPHHGGGGVELYDDSAFPVSGVTVGQFDCGDGGWSLAQNMALVSPLARSAPQIAQTARETPRIERKPEGQKKCCGSASDKSPLRVERKAK